MDYRYPLPPRLRRGTPIVVVSWLTVAEAAAEIGRSVKTVQEWCRTGRLRRVRRSTSGRRPVLLIASCCVRAEQETALCECAPEGAT